MKWFKLTACLVMAAIVATLPILSVFNLLSDSKSWGKTIGLNDEMLIWLFEGVFLTATAAVTWLLYRALDYLPICRTWFVRWKTSHVHHLNH